jgi:hypothetical protein
MASQLRLLGLSADFLRFFALCGRVGSSGTQHQQ